MSVVLYVKKYTVNDCVAPVRSSSKVVSKVEEYV